MLKNKIITNLKREKVSKYHNDVLVYYKEFYQNKQKAIDIEQTMLNTKWKLKISDPVFYSVNHQLLVHYTYYYYELLKPELQVLLNKLTLPKVDMEVLIDDLNEYMNVEQLLIELHKHGNNITPIMDYFSRHKIEISRIMSILYNHKITVQHLLQNPYIRELIKNSPNCSWLIGSQQVTQPEIVYKNYGKKLVKKINVQAMYNVSDESIIYIHWGN